MAVHDDVLLPERQGKPGGQADLLLDQIDTGHHFGDRMFDLDARVHFHEEEVAILVEKELHGADVPVMRGFHGFDRDASDFFSQLVIDRR